MLDLSRVNKPKNRVVRAGVELEGAWKVLPPGTTLEHDGSVFRDARERLGLPNRNIGELPLGPLQPAAMPKLMKKYYPHIVDKTCGMHVHMSFENLKYYGWLMEEEYQDTLLESLTQWAKGEKFDPKHHIWSRLRGESVFCQKVFWPDLQVAWKRKDHDQTRDGHRYTIVHYCGRMNTIEIRVLPMMETVEQAIRAVQHVIDMTNTALVLLADRHMKDAVVGGKIELAPNTFYEESIEEEIPLTSAQRRRLR